MGFAQSRAMPLRPPPLLILALGLACASGCGRLTAPGGNGPAAPPTLDLGLSAHPSAALVSVVPEAGRVAATWRVAGFDPGTEPQLALFVGTDAATLFATPPIDLDVTARGHIADGLAPDQLYFVGLALDTGGAHEPLPPVLRARTGDPIYADPASTAATPTGDDPNSAFPTLAAALLRALDIGGGNVFLAGADFGGLALEVPEEAHVYGGFAPGFVLEERDPGAHPTLLRGSGSANVLTIDSTLDAVVLDGLFIDGAGSASAGVEVVRGRAELRSLSVRACRRGIKLQGPQTGTPPLVRVSGGAFFSNDLQGISLEGVYSLEVQSCVLSANGQEGLDANDLIAPTAGDVHISVRDSRFVGNAAEGLDIDLAAGLGFDVGYRIELEDCDFERNLESGVRIDMDFEGAPDHRADLSLLGLHTSGNGGSGIDLDLDAEGTAFVHRCVSSANSGNGLNATSETRAGLLLISSSVFMGNAGRGVSLSEGNWGGIVSHCVLAGNDGGGMASPFVGSSSISSVAYLQPSPWSGTRVRAGLITSETLPSPFEHAPTAFARVVAIDSAGVELATTPSFGVGTLVELADDGTPRSATSLSGRDVALAPAPSARPLPTSLAAFPAAPEANTRESWAPGAGSALVGAGSPRPDGAPVDAGPFGAPAGGAPGQLELGSAEPFRAAGLEPPLGQAFTPSTDLLLDFAGGAPDPASVPVSLRILRGGGEIGASAMVEGARLRVLAPAAGWQDGDLVEVHGNLRSLEGRCLASAIGVPVRVP